MNYKPIIVIAGEPYSVFLELFFKTIKNNNFRKPIILIGSKKLILLQMKKLNFNFKINLLNLKNFKLNNYNNKKINLINVNFTFKRVFEKISDK